MGVAAPGLWLAMGPLTGQIEFRHFRDDFDSGADRHASFGAGRIDPDLLARAAARLAETTEVHLVLGDMRAFDATCTFAPSDGFDRIRQNLRVVELQDGVLRLFNVTMQASGKAFDVSVHGSGRHLIIEFEPKVATRGRDMLAEVYPGGAESLAMLDRRDRATISAYARGRESI